MKIVWLAFSHKPTKNLFKKNLIAQNFRDVFVTGHKRQNNGLLKTRVTKVMMVLQ